MVPSFDGAPAAVPQSLTSIRTVGTAALIGSIAWFDRETLCERADLANT
jgi:hypothetical protein